jgi:hypothetical protein
MMSQHTIVRALVIWGFYVYPLIQSLAIQGKYSDFYNYPTQYSIPSSYTQVNQLQAKLKVGDLRNQALRLLAQNLNTETKDLKIHTA